MLPKKQQKQFIRQFLVIFLKTENKTIKLNLTFKTKIFLDKNKTKSFSYYKTEYSKKCVE